MWNPNCATLKRSLNSLQPLCTGECICFWSHSPQSGSLPHLLGKSLSQELLQVNKIHRKQPPKLSWTLMLRQIHTFKEEWTKTGCNLKSLQFQTINKIIWMYVYAFLKLLQWFAGNICICYSPASNPCYTIKLGEEWSGKIRREYFYSWYLQLKKITITFYLLWQSHISLTPTMKLFSYFQFQRTIVKDFH